MTGNGLVFTTRFAGVRGGRNAREAELRRLGITQKNDKPNHPQTQGKAERFQQTLNNWLRAQPGQPAIVSELQTPPVTTSPPENHPAPTKKTPNPLRVRCHSCVLRDHIAIWTRLEPHAPDLQICDA